ncbi:mucin-2-like [Saccostrea echinata]|uniref:mucin-2-like n=1 Tax=Saccostrea echinata TaxID=191078 RepID=UPI002A81EEEA|nr:mucin-2-like [Saccostrea echinata]
MFLAEKFEENPDYTLEKVNYYKVHITKKTDEIKKEAKIPDAPQSSQVTILTSSRGDPCEEYLSLPNPYDRYLTNNISGSAVSILHDRHIEEGWYRAGYAMDMPTTPPSSHLHCGTTFPAWMNGSIPNTTDGEAERRVCFLGHIQGNFCIHHIDIKVKNCGVYRVYRLPPTQSNDEAYCFGEYKHNIDIENDNSSFSVTTSSVTDDVTSIPELDPCYNYSPLPNAYDRYYLNVLNGSTGAHIHDRHLEEGWYRAGHSLDMPNIPPSLLHCGTIFPVWIDGEIPDTDDGIAERKVCFLGHVVGNFCVHHLQIFVKNCGVYRVYYLYPTPSNDEAYCFGMDRTESTPVSVKSTTPHTTLHTTDNSHDVNSTLPIPQETITTDDSELDLTTSDYYTTADFGTSVSNITLSTQSTQQFTTSSKPHTTPQTDPCSSYSILPNYGDRFIENVVSENSSFIDDKDLPEQWYRAGNLDIPIRRPNLYHCGTMYPGYLTGSIPPTNVTTTTFSTTQTTHVSSATNTTLPIPQQTTTDELELYLTTLDQYTSTKSTIFVSNGTVITTNASSTPHPTLKTTVINVTNSTTAIPQKTTTESSGSVIITNVSSTQRPTLSTTHSINVTNSTIVLPNITTTEYPDSNLTTNASSTSYPPSQSTPIINDTNSIKPTTQESTTENSDNNVPTTSKPITTSQTSSQQTTETTNGNTTQTPTSTTMQQTTNKSTTTGSPILTSSYSSMKPTSTNWTESTNRPSPTPTAFTTPETMDPCIYYTNLTDIEKRFHTNRIQANSTSSLSDHLLVYGWYGTGGHGLLTSSAIRYHCGTFNPIWINGNIPPVEGGVVDRTACIVTDTNCGITISIKIRNCGTHRVYQLRPTVVFSAYCIYDYNVPTSTKPITTSQMSSQQTTGTTHGNTTQMPTSTTMQQTTTNQSTTTGSPILTSSYSSMKPTSTNWTESTNRPSSTPTALTTPETMDPCIYYTNLTDIEKRFHTNRIQANSTSSLSDHLLVYGWYGTGGHDLLTSSAIRYHCGTFNPIWINGNIPPVEGGVVDRTACIVTDTNCGITISIKIRNCGTHRVYQLRPTVVFSAYCIYDYNVPTSTKPITTSQMSSQQTTGTTHGNTTQMPTSTTMQQTTTNQSTTTGSPILTSSYSSMKPTSTNWTESTNRPSSTPTALTTPETMDPCIYYTNLTDIEKRFHTNRIQANSTSSLSDHLLVYGWYGTGGHDLLTSSAIRYHCGTFNPIWINGNIPPVEGGVVDRTACIVTDTNCGITISIKIRNCGTHRVYQLRPTVVFSAYCIYDYNVPTSTKPITTSQMSSQQTTGTTHGNTTQMPTSTTMQQTTTNQSTTTGSPILTSSYSSMKPTSTNWTESTNRSSSTPTALTTPETMDPCIYYTNLTDIEKRFHTNRIQANSTSSLSDHLLVYGWYGTGGHDLLTSSAIRYHCGTFNPIWINGNIPPVEGGVVDRTACIVTDTNCGITISIKIRNCGTHRVYQLRPTVVFSAYCIYDYNVPTSTKPITTSQMSSQQTTGTTHGNTTQMPTSTTMQQTTTNQSTTTGSPILTSSYSSMKPTSTNWTESTNRPSSTPTALTTPETMDPCIYYTNLTDIEKRFHTNRIQANSTSSLSDHLLVYGWYGTGGHDLLTSSAIRYHCGTFNPIWINGNIPPVEGGVVDRTACIVTDTNCGITISIKIRNCGTHRVYQLRPTVVFSAYCIYDYNVPTSTKPITTSQMSSQQTTGTTHGNTTQMPTSTTMQQTTTNQSTTTGSPILTSSYSSMKPTSTNWTESTNRPSSTPTALTTPETMDPCIYYTNLTDIEKRFHTNRIQANSTSSLSDHLLVYGWYGTGGHDLLTSSAIRYHCGTFNPIWINGNIPPVEGGVVDRTACIVTDTNCGITISIKIRNCGTHRVYQLRPTVVFSAYCIYDYNVPTSTKPITTSQMSSQQTTGTTHGNTTQMPTSTTMQQTTTNQSTTTGSPILTSSYSSMKPTSTNWTESTNRPSSTPTALTTPETMDPCIYYTNLTDIEKRFHTNRIQANSTSSLSDHLLVYGWYGTGGHDLLTSSAMRYHCGTFNPIWINGNIPPVEGGVVDRTACIVTDTNCGITISIKIRNCGTHRVYQLQPTVVFSAYCIYDYNVPTSTKPITTSQMSSQQTTGTTHGNTTQMPTSTTMQQTTTNQSTTTGSPILTSSYSSMKPTSTNWTESTNRPSSTPTALTTPETMDPCIYYTNLTDIEKRFHTNRIQANSTSSLSDHLLVYGWYGTGGHDLLTSSAMRYHCGTFNPIWINGNIPPVEGGVVDRTACIVTDTNCGITISIKIRNCGTHRVYQLQPTVVFSAYCIHDYDVPTTLEPMTTIQTSSTSQQTPSPSPTLSRAEVEVHLVPEGISQVFQARCTFNASNARGLRFKITWYFDDVFDSSYSATLENIYSTYIYLQRDNFKTLGRNISCAVDMLRNDGTTIESRKSHEQFLGIKILTPVVTFKRGEEGKIQLQLTVPIGCLQLVSQCDVILAMMDQSEDQCTGAAVSGQRDCGISLKSREWNKIFEIPVGAIEEEGHEYSATYEVVLRTDAHFHQPIWGLYELPPVKIVIEEGSDREWSKKYCRAVNDPHLLTFDQRPYDVHLKGDFIMYEHKTAPIQVQARFKPCYGNSGPHCTCGVAVQAGRDVFVIDRCQSKKRLRRMMYTSCMDHTLEVRKRHDYLYNMYTPYGTRIQVNLRGKTYMNLQIYPSIRDVGQTRGLCGTLSNECADDFLLRNGNYLNEVAANKTCGNFGWSDYRWNPDAFSRSWMVAENESLFEDYDPSNSEWPRERYLCSCKKNVVKVRIDGRGTPDCSSSVVSNCTRRREKVVAVGGGCEVKRSSSKYGFKPYDATRVRRQEPNQRRIKRVDSQIQLTTIDNATSFCQTHLSKSEAFKLCGDIPNVNKKDAIETCALDIVLTNGSLEWADNPKEAMIDRCVSELRLNATLNTESNNTPSVAETIRNIACPNDCSDVGTCVNGTCICPPLYGASDCSLNVSVPPEIYGIEGDGYCDVSQMSCDQILIAGDDFTETGSYNCRIEITHLLFDGAISSAGLKTLNGDMQTLMSVSCPVPVREKFASRSLPRTSPVFVRTFNVSLSSEGNTYSESFQFYQYNSTYQDFQILDGKPTFSLKSGYCFIDEEGIPDGWRKTTDICNACNSSVNILEWTPVNSPECEVIREPVDKSYFDSTELYWMLGLVIAVILIIIMVVCQHRCRRIRSKRKSSYDVSTESSYNGAELQDLSIYF